MLRDYEIVSPSLEGVLSDSTLTYEGIVRPVELLRVLDGPASKGRGKDKKETDSGAYERDAHQAKILEQYFHDLYGVFMKRLSTFILESELITEESIKLQAMLQEIVKVKKLMTKYRV